MCAFALYPSRESVLGRSFPGHFAVDNQTCELPSEGLSWIGTNRPREPACSAIVFRHFTDYELLILYVLSTGVVDYLNTEISTSKQKKFSLVTFVDTPGLVDGDMKYPFDVNESILWLGNNRCATHEKSIAHVFSFQVNWPTWFSCFSIRSARRCASELWTLLSSWTLAIQNAFVFIFQRRMRLARNRTGKGQSFFHLFFSSLVRLIIFHFRFRVMMQIVQELCKRPGLNKTGFDMPTIYIPNPNKVDEVWHCE